jgi:hypothetical protein
VNARQIAAPALTYFALVFGAGFLLGILRVFWLAPVLGARAAELAETPVMLIVIFFAARWIAKHFAVPSSATVRLSIGLIALVCLLAVEFTVVLWLQGITIRESIAKRDAVSGAVYAASLILFALMPLFVGPARRVTTR